MTDFPAFPALISARHHVVSRIRARIPHVTGAIVSEARAQMPSYAALGHAAVTTYAAALIERMLAALSEERELNSDDCRELREYGEARAQQGISLVDVQHGWRIALRCFRAALVADGRAQHISDEVLLELSHAMLDLVDQAALVYGQGHREVELEIARLDHQVRAEFVRRVLHGTLGPAGIRVQAHQYGLDIDGSYQAFRTRSESRDADTELLQRLRSDGLKVVFTTTIDDDIAGFISAPAMLRTEAPLGLGPACRLEELGRSFRLASRLLLTADVFDLQGPTELTGVGLLAAVVGEADIGSELVKHYLEPVGAGAAARTIIDTVERHLDTGMHIETTAEMLVVHPNTVRYRISRFEELADADLRSPVTAARVWWAIKHQRATS